MSIYISGLWEHKNSILQFTNILLNYDYKIKYNFINSNNVNCKNLINYIQLSYIGIKSSDIYLLFITDIENKYKSSLIDISLSLLFGKKILIIDLCLNSTFKKNNIIDNNIKYFNYPIIIKKSNLNVVSNLNTISTNLNVISNLNEILSIDYKSNLDEISNLILTIIFLQNLKN